MVNPRLCATTSAINISLIGSLASVSDMKAEGLIEEMVRNDLELSSLNMKEE